LGRLGQHGDRGETEQGYLYRLGNDLDIQRPTVPRPAFGEPAEDQRAIAGLEDAIFGAVRSDRDRQQDERVGQENRASRGRPTKPRMAVCALRAFPPYASAE